MGLGDSDTELLPLKLKLELDEELQVGEGEIVPVMVEEELELGVTVPVMVCEVLGVWLWERLAVTVEEPEMLGVPVFEGELVRLEVKLGVGETEGVSLIVLLIDGVIEGVRVFVEVGQTPVTLLQMPPV